MNTPSVISSSSRLGGSWDAASAPITMPGSAGLANWIGETLTATRICSGQVAGGGAGGADHPFADLRDQADFLGDGDEQIGAHRPARRMVPADQRLEADDPLVGFEALMRWTHPTRGPVRPDIFIPIAEEIGLIPQIGEWVIRTACPAAARWPEHIRVAVNVSPIQFASPALPGIVMGALAASQLPPNRLELEITEGVFMGDGAATEAMFARLKAIGVRFALDDFGTGYSSLGYLKKAPFDKIKIDQSFVRGASIPGNRNAAIIRAIVALATSLDMDTTAEGAETLDELELIRSLGCSHIQGYVFGKPMPADEVMERVKGTATLNPSGFLASRARAPRCCVRRRCGGRTRLFRAAAQHLCRRRDDRDRQPARSGHGGRDRAARRPPPGRGRALGARRPYRHDLRPSVDLDALNARLVSPPRVARMG